MGLTKIAWCDYTMNPWWGCERVSPGCQHCYAEAWAKRTGHGVWGRNADRRFLSDKHWDEPLAWDRKAAKAGRPALVFCASMADVFEDRRDLDEHRSRLWELVVSTPNLRWLLLTKRPQNVRDMVPLRWLERWPECPGVACGYRHDPNRPCFTDETQADSGWPPNVWVGTTCEDQARADERIPHLLDIPAPVRFLSCEPLLGPVSLGRWLDACSMSKRVDGPLHNFRWDGDNPEVICSFCGERRDARTGATIGQSRSVTPEIHWVIAGGETGGQRRPFDNDWARSLRDQCSTASVPFFYKQDSGLHPGTPGPADLDPLKTWPVDAGDRSAVAVEVRT